MGKAYEKVYEVTYGETDGRKDCRITSMMNFFSDCCLSQEEKNSMNYADNSSETRRPARISDEEYEIHGLSKESSKLLRKKLNFEKFDKEDLEMNFHIRYLDIDLNMHVSNIKYVEWILETVPVDIVLNYKMKKIKIKFEKEITYGHNVIIKSKIIKGEDEVKVLHKVENEEGESITLAETYWY